MLSHNRGQSASSRSNSRASYAYKTVTLLKVLKLPRFSIENTYKIDITNYKLQSRDYVVKQHKANLTVECHVVNRYIASRGDSRRASRGYKNRYIVRRPTRLTPAPHILNAEASPYILAVKPAMIFCIAGAAIHIFAVKAAMIFCIAGAALGTFCIAGAALFPYSPS